MKPIDKLTTKWLNKEEKINKWNPNKKKRNYLHFDFKQSPRHALHFINNPSEVSKRPFYPFIEKEIRSRVFSKSENKFVYKLRKVYYAAHSDSYVLSWYTHLLNEEYEKYILSQEFEKCVIAYRTNKGNSVDLAKEAIEEVQIKGECCIICIDVSSFFESFLHVDIFNSVSKLLNKKKLPEDWIKILKIVTQYHYVKENELFKLLGILRKRDMKNFRKIDIEILKKLNKQGSVYSAPSTGIAQGTPISAVLSNTYMITIDEKIYSYLSSKNAFYRRYSDDIIIICDKKNSKSILSRVTKLLKSKGLSIQTQKTNEFITKKDKNGKIVITCTNNPQTKFQYLGIEFDGNSIRFRSSTVSRFYRRLKQAIASAKYHTIRNRTPFLSQKKLYRKFTDLGDKNFFNYVRTTSKKIINGLFVRQFRRHKRILRTQINKATMELNLPHARK